MNSSQQNAPSAREVSEALALLKREERAHLWRSAFTALTWVFALATCFAVIHEKGMDPYYSVPLMLLSLICLISGTVAIPRANRSAAAILMRLNDVSGVGPLVEARNLLGSEDRRTITDMLTNLLPRMTWKDASYLSPVQRQKLLQELMLGDIYHETDLLLAILKALERIGDENALPEVQRLAQGGPEAWQMETRRGFETWQEQRVREAAHTCLLVMQERLEQQQISHILLRPATLPTSELLRPAEEVETEPAQLLRAVEQERNG
jgi:hypothetical protein